MVIIDLSNASSHFYNDRQTRIDIIEKTVGFGEPLYEMEDPKGRDGKRVLTSTGVLLVVGENNFIITAWIASVKQASVVYFNATGKTKFPPHLWNVINYNNNTEFWQKKVAA